MTQKYDIESDDATWILTSAFIIFTMQSGFGLLESGFGTDEHSNGFTGIGAFFTDASDAQMGSVFAKYFFQLSFATTATTIVSGALAERTNLKAYIAFSFFNTLTYCFPAHWIWASNGWLNKLGAIDIAGASAVHVVGGASGLVATLYLGPRIGCFKRRRRGEPFTTMASPTNVILGTFMLWWGWLGFNCGSTFGISGKKWKFAARSAVCTINSSVGGGICGIIYSYISCKNKLRIEKFVTGILGGLVGITASCTVTKPWEALVIGAVGGTIACFGCRLLKRLKIDDPVGCVPVHLFSGVWSLIAVVFFVEKDLLEHVNDNKNFDNRWKLLGIQITLVACCSVWAGIITLLLFIVINIFTPVRMSLEEEIQGADLVEHGIKPVFEPSNNDCCGEDKTGSLNAVSSIRTENKVCKKCQRYAVLDVNDLEWIPASSTDGLVIVHLGNSNTTQHIQKAVQDKCRNRSKPQLCPTCEGKLQAHDSEQEDVDTSML